MYIIICDINTNFNNIIINGIKKYIKIYSETILPYNIFSSKNKYIIFQIKSYYLNVFILYSKY